MDSSFPCHFMVGPDVMCMTTTYALTLGGGILVALFLTEAESWRRWMMLGVSVATALVFSFAACSDPGIIFQDFTECPVVDPGALINHGDGNGNVNGDVEGGNSGVKKRGLRPPSTTIRFTQCVHCDLYRPSTASHCYDCNLCIDNLDHHCPWTGKCIGKKNIYRFYAFLACVLLEFTFAIGVVIQNTLERSDGGPQRG